MITCPYCGKGALPLTGEAAVWCDVVGRAGWMVRAFLELKATPVFSWPNLARHLLARESVEIPPDEGRPCPYCRRGVVTRHNAQSIWLDLGARVVGLGRVYFELSENRPGLTWHELATVLVEGSDADLSYLDSEPIEGKAAEVGEGGDDGRPEQRGGFASLDLARG